MPCDFFLSGWAKEQIYHMKPRSMDELEERITNVPTNISENMLQSAVVNVPVRLRKCADSTGAYVEI
jgi:hypothetical protein